MSTSIETSRSVRASVGRELLVFFAAAVAVSWLLGGAGIVLFGDIGLSLGVLSLPVVASVLTWRQAGTLMPLWSQVTRWRVGWRWFAAAAALPVAIIATASVLIVMVFHAMWNLALSWVPVTAAAWSLLAGLTTVVAVGLVVRFGRVHLSSRQRFRPTDTAMA